MAKRIPWFEPQTDQRERELILEVLDSNYLNEGDMTRKFEKQIAEFLGVKHCVAVTSGTAAIFLSLKAAGLKEGDEVLVPDLTFIATANAAKLAGLNVRLVDIERKRLNISPEAIEKRLTPRTKAIVPVDVNGRGADYDFLESFCKKKGLILITDSAEALGSKYNGKFLGTFGLAGCFSFSSNKSLTTGQGGMISTNSSQMYQRLVELKDQGRAKQGTGGNDLHPVVGFNFKFTNLQAAIGLAQFEKLSHRLKMSNERDQKYQKHLTEVSSIRFPDMAHPGEVRQWTDILSVQSDLIEQKLKEQQIGSRRFWYPLHTQAPYKDDPALFENAVKISQEGLWLPSYFGISSHEIEMTTDLIKKVVLNG